MVKTLEGPRPQIVTAGGGRLSPTRGSPVLTADFDVAWDGGDRAEVLVAVVVGITAARIPVGPSPTDTTSWFAVRDRQSRSGAPLIVTSTVMNPVCSFFVLARGLRSAHPVRKHSTRALSNGAHTAVPPSLGPAV